MSSPCPAPEALSSLFVGPRPPTNARGILEHLKCCLSCRQTLAELQPGLEIPAPFRPDGKDQCSENAVAAPGAKTDPGTISESLDTAFAVFAGLPSRPRPAYDVPRRLGGHEVIRVLGRGGMGCVLKALDPALNRFVAIKLLIPELAQDESGRERFAREARAAATIGSDHVTSVYSVGQEGNAPYIVMEYISGEDLETRLRRLGRLPISVAISIARQVGAALTAAHLRGIIHRDIKPANILLEGTPGLDANETSESLIRVKITDFGIAKAAGLPSLTGAQETIGTPEYMSPEQIAGDPIDSRSDLYSFGVLLYRMFTDKLPFHAKTAVACFAQHLTKEPAAPTTHVADLPPWLETLILRLLRKEPDERVQTALEVVRMLDTGAAQLNGPPTDPEEKRLAALRSYRVLDTDSEQSFDDLTFLASHICGTPIAALSLIDEDRQWFKSKVGLSVSQTARNISFCQYTIRGTDPMIVGNAMTDQRFADNPLVRGEPGIRFYAGVPLINTEGCALGSLCVIDRVPRGLSCEQLAALGALGRLVMSQLESRRELMELREGVESAV